MNERQCGKKENSLWYEKVQSVKTVTFPVLKNKFLTKQPVLRITVPHTFQRLFSNTWAVHKTAYSAHVSIFSAL
jgi:hypothetical protein